MHAIVTLVQALIGQAASLPVDADQAALDHLLQGLGGANGAGAIGIAITITQVLMFAARGPIGTMSGKWQLTIVSGVAMLATVLMGKSAGMTWTAALLSGPVVAALQVFGHQLFKNFTAPKADVAADPPKG